VPPRSGPLALATSAGCPRCARLEQAQAALRRQLEQRDAQIAELRERLEQAERAGKRQAAPFAKGAPTAAPKRPGRKPGADYGTKAWRPVPDHVDESYEAPLGPRCPYCHSDQVDETKVVEIYEEDIPPVRPRVRRFRVHVGRCRHCRRRIQGRHPLQSSTAVGAARVHLGPSVLALGAELQKRTGTPYGKLARMLHLAFALSVTPGGLCLALRRVAAALAPTYDALVQRVRHAPVVAADETGWKVAGRLQWLWVFVSQEVTVYRILDGRGFDQACVVLEAHFAGLLLRDGWSPYRRFVEAVHQTCLGHLIRRCTRLLETAQRGAARLPHAIRRLLRDALALRDHWQEHAPSPRGRAVHVGRLCARLDRYLDWQPTDADNRKLLKHLRTERDAVFTFLRHPEVEATNWPAEQAIRPAVVTRKVCGGNRTPRGATTQYVLASVLQTCHQQGVDPFPLIADLLRAPAPRVAPLPALLSGP
jgi:transposase